jgi:hypothetical protein
MLRVKRKQSNIKGFNMTDDHPNEEDVQRSEVLWEEIQQLRIPHKEAIKKIQIKYGLA